MRKLKLSYIFCIQFFAVIAGASHVFAQDFHDKNTYSVLDELAYTALMSDYNNSLILNLAGTKSTSPDQRSQIEQLRQTDPLRMMQAELLATQIYGKMNLLQIKEKTINGFKTEKINLLEGKFDLEKIRKISAYYSEQLDQTLKHFAENPRPDPYEAMIDFYLFDPDISYNFSAQDFPEALVNSAIKIAVSRFDNVKWHRQIRNCLIEMKIPDEEKIPSIITCAEKYFAAVSEETAKVAGELQKHHTFFEKLTPVPDQSEMTKEEKGETFRWKRKK